MSRFQRYPWLSLVTLGAFVLLCGLSYWQVERLSWKRSIIHEMEQALAAPPLIITSAKQFQKLPDFRRVAIEGTLLNTETLHLQARYYKGNLGFGLITPLRLKDGTLVFLNRGWVPKDYKTNPKVKISQPTGTIKITGILRSDEHPRSYLPQNAPEKGLWLWQDTTAWGTLLQNKLPKATVLPILIQQTREARKDDGFPIPQESHFELRNDHLQYALTWGSFALILLVIYVIYTNPKRKTSRLS